MADRFELELTGLRPKPLALYLGALGVLRLVSEQVDAGAHGWWRGHTFVLESTLDADGLIRFILDDYRPTPVLGPWNGGSGFFPSDKAGIDAIAAIMASEDERFTDYQRIIAEIRAVLDKLGLTAKPDKKAKGPLLARLRAELSDEALEWIDAALILTNDGERFPPLLGTGGNDGRFEFSTNFMKRLGELLLSKKAPSPALVRGYLFGEPTPGMVKAPVGQFLPSQAGGANNTPGYSGDSQINPWSYVLAIEGAMVPSGAATRRLESTRSASPAFPFTLRSTLVGYASASDEDSRDELWMPQWEQPVGFAELRQLFVEGRAKVPTGSGKRGRREAVDGLDFARAIATLGVDRGISSFTRFGLRQRNGLSYFAVPLGDWQVKRSTSADLLAELDRWLGRLRGRVSSGKLPGSLTRAARSVDAQIMEVCRRDDPVAVLDLLVSLGQVEVLAGRVKDPILEPVPALSPEWLERVEDGSPELRLAASLAGAGIRRRVTPVERLGYGRWAWLSVNGKHVTWSASADLVSNLLALLHRKEIERQQGADRNERFADAAILGIGRERGTPRRWAELEDVAALIDGELDERRLEALMRGLMLINWPKVEATRPNLAPSVLPPAGFGLLALARDLEVHDGAGPGQPLPPTPGLLANAATGRLEVASRLAIRRLHGVGRHYPRAALSESGDRSRRITAALAFPLARAQLCLLERGLFPRYRDTKDANT